MERKEERTNDRKRNELSCFTVNLKVYFRHGRCSDNVPRFILWAWKYLMRCRPVERMAPSDMGRRSQTINKVREAETLDHLGGETGQSH
jgi:hypothetical protein